MKTMKRNALVSSILVIALCLSLIAGATFALFTNKDTINVAVNAAKVNIVAVIENVRIFSMGEEFDYDEATNQGTFELGGTAKYDTVTGEFDLDRVAPGDKVTFDIKITNNSNIDIQYRVKWAVDGELMGALEAGVKEEDDDNYTALATETSAWTPWDLPVNGSETKVLNLSLELPVETGDEYQEKSAAVSFVVEAVQGNAIVDEVATLDQLKSTLMMGRTATLGADIELGEEPLTVAAGTVATIDLGAYTITGNNTAAVIVNNGTLNIVGTTGTLTNSAVNGGAVVENNGTMTISGANIVGAPIGETDYPEYAVINKGDLTIEDGTTITSQRGALRIEAEGTTTINGGTFTNEDIDRTLTSHVVDVTPDAANHTLIINGGTFQHLHDETSGGVVICNRTKGTVYVNGGSFSGGNYYGDDNLSDYGYGGTFSVTGGTYTAKPAAKYIAEYYEVVDNADGTYTVQVKDGVTFVKNDAELAAAIDAINTDSAYWNTPITVVLKAGEYSGEYTIKQYPAYTAGGAIVSADSDYINLALVAQKGALFTGHITVIGNGNGGGYATNHIGTTFKNFTFDATDSYVSETTRRNILLTYGTDKVIFDGCTFKNATHINVGESGQKSVFNTKFVNCTFENGGNISGYWPGSSNSTVTLENCKGDMGDKGIVNGQKAGYVYVKNSDLVAGEYGFRTNASLNITVEDSSITIRDNAPLVFFRDAGSSLTVTGDCDINCAYVAEYSAESLKDTCTVTVDGNVLSLDEKSGLYYNGKARGATYYIFGEADLVKAAEYFVHQTNSNEGNIVTIELMTDIDLADQIWNSWTVMWVTFNGNGHTISNVTNANGWRGGFFGYIGASKVNDLTLKNVKSYGAQAGTIAGSVEGVTMTNCTLEGENSVTYVPYSNPSYTEEAGGIGAVTGVLVESTVNVEIAEGATVALGNTSFSTDIDYQNDLTGYLQANKGTVTNNGTVTK